MEFRGLDEREYSLRRSPPLDRGPLPGPGLGFDSPPKASLCPPPPSKPGLRPASRTFPARPPSPRRSSSRTATPCPSSPATGRTRRVGSTRPRCGAWSRRARSSSGWKRGGRPSWKRRSGTRSARPRWRSASSPPPISRASRTWPCPSARRRARRSSRAKPASSPSPTGSGPPATAPRPRRRARPSTSGPSPSAIPRRASSEAKDAIAGAQALLVERLAEDPDLRAEVRRVVFAHGLVEAVKTEKAKAGSKHEAVLGLREKATTLRERDHLHRVFGLRRAANEGEVKLRVVLPEGEESPRKALEEAFAAAALSLPDAPGAAVLRDAAREALDGHVWPDMAAELLQSLREEADRTAIRPLAEGLRRRLLAPALGNQPVLGLHPTKDGGVLALVDARRAGSSRASRFALADDQIAAARERILGLAREGEVAAVAVGDGTAGRERAQFVEETLAGASLSTVVVQVLSEAAAAAWRTSEAASAELPETEVETLSAVALARRLQDPLRELARTEPRVLAEGAYLHEVSQRLLGKRLEQTLETCLHDVGVDPNRASAATLARLAGFSAGDGPGPRGPARGAGAVRLAGRASGDRPAGRQGLRAGGRVPRDGRLGPPARPDARSSRTVRRPRGLRGAPGQGPVRSAGRGRLRPAGRRRAARGARTPHPRQRGGPARGGGPGSPRSLRALPLPRRRAAPGRPEAGHGVSRPGHERHHLRGVRGPGRAPRRPRPRVAAPAARGREGGAPLLLPGDRVEVRVVKVDLAKKQISLSMRGAPARGPRTAADRSTARRREGARRAHGRPASARPFREARLPPAEPEAGRRPGHDSSGLRARRSPAVGGPSASRRGSPPSRRDVATRIGARVSAGSAARPSGSSRAPSRGAPPERPPPGLQQPVRRPGLAEGPEEGLSPEVGLTATPARSGPVRSLSGANLDSGGSVTMSGAKRPLPRLW